MVCALNISFILFFKYLFVIAAKEIYHVCHTITVYETQPDDRWTHRKTAESYKQSSVLPFRQGTLKKRQTKCKSHSKFDFH